MHGTNFINVLTIILSCCIAYHICVKPEIHRLKGGGEGNREYISVKCMQREKKVKRMEPDGNCLFRAIAHAFHGDATLHEAVRSEIVAALLKNQMDFEGNALIYSPQWTAELTKNPTKNSYLDYVDYISASNSHGDTVNVVQIRIFGLRRLYLCLKLAW